MSIKPINHTVAFSLLTGAAAGQLFGSFPASYVATRAALGPRTAAEALADLRAGYLPALGYSALLGSAAALAARSWLPLLASIGAATVLLTQYEGALPPESRWRLTDMLRPASLAPACPTCQAALPTGRDIGV